MESLRSEFPAQIECLIGDMADLGTGARAVELALSTWDTLDGVIVNHGVLDPIARIADANLEEWKTAYDINFLSGVALV